jgi:hypothetical protein
MSHFHQKLECDPPQIACNSIEQIKADALAMLKERGITGKRHRDPIAQHERRMEKHAERRRAKKS